jgi:hypothetical protein
MSKAELIENIKALFFNREDCYGAYSNLIPGKKSSLWTAKSKVTEQVVENHLQGHHVRGAHTTSKENTCKWCALDFDSAAPAKELYITKGDYSLLKKEKEALLEEALYTQEILSQLGIASVLENSTGGYHLWIFFECPMDSSIAFEFISLLRKVCVKKSKADCFPTQAKLGKKDGFGNWLRLPGRYHSSTQFGYVWNHLFWISLNPNTQYWEYAWDVFFQCKKASKEVVLLAIEKLQAKNASLASEDTLPTPKMVSIPTVHRTPKLDVVDNLGEWVQSHLEQTDLVQVMSRYYDLRKMKNNPNGSISFCCPFHEDKNPSAWISSFNGIGYFHCCACSETGKNAMHIVAEHKGLNLRGLRGADFFEVCQETFGEMPVFERPLPKQCEDIVSILVANIEPIAPVQPEKEAKVEKSIYEAFDSNVKWNVLEAPTGTFKTTEACKKAVALALEFRLVTIFVASRNEAERLVGILKGLQNELPMEQQNRIKISLHLSTMSEEYSGEVIPVGNIAVTTYAYLGLKGHNNCLYSIAKELTQFRIIFADECHCLWNKILVKVFLSSLFVKKDDGEKVSWLHTPKCPKTARKGNCSYCKFSWVKDAANGTPVKRDFPASKSSIQMEKEMENPQISPLCQNHLDLSLWQYCIGNVFCQPLASSKEVSDAAMLNLYENTKLKTTCSEEAWLHTLLNCLYTAHLRVELPIFKEKDGRQFIVTPEQITGMEDDEKKKVKFPVQSCNSVSLCGVDLLPIFQLAQANQIFFLSATVPVQMVEFLQEIGFNPNFVQIERIPYRFDITLLKTDKRLSLDKQCQLINEINDETNEIFWVTSNKAEAQAAQRKLSQVKRIRLYFEDGYEQIVQKDSVLASKESFVPIVLTYGGSPIAQSENFPNVTNMIIDCQQFIPFADLASVRPGMKLEDIVKEMLKDINGRLIQIMGRLLRSTLPSEPGKSVDDPRKIVILLHGLPKELQAIAINPALCHSSVELVNEQFTGNDDKQLVSCIANIIKGNKTAENLAKALQSIEKNSQRANEDVVETYKKKGIEFIAPSKRESITEEVKMEIKAEKKSEKEDEKIESLKSKIKELALKGFNWRDVHHKLHLSRLKNEKVISLLKTFFLEVLSASSIWT